ncbi:hypothetical protein [Neobacillus sp. LXY-1]|uniref:hypothetical protein n=1 Tax=Neobacillus sp. LXY-1 TaxID=3379133 RepID=UPI003EE2F29D
MNNLEDIISQYIEDLEERMHQIQQVQRKNLVEEIRDHLNSYAEDLKKKGLSTNEIAQKIKDEFLSLNELATEFMEASNKISFGRKVKHHLGLLFPIVVGIIGITVFPEYQELLLALMLFIYSYVILFKKTIWGFAVIRKKPARVRHKEKIAQLGSIYLFVLGMIFLVGQYVTFPNKQLLFMAMVILVSAGFYFYMNKKLVH